MKKILFALLLLIPVTVRSQDSTSAPVEKKGFIAIMVGPSFPVGDYGSDDLNGNDQAGLAKTGFSLFLVDFGYKFNKHFGFAASWIGGSNAIDAQILANSLANEYGGSWVVETGAFSYGGLFAGLFYTIPCKRLEVDIRALAGFASGNFPEIKAVESSGFRFTQENATGTSVGYTFGAGIRYHISKKISFITRLDYVAMKPEGEVTTTIYNPGFAPLEDELEVEQPMNTLNFNLGIAFRLK